MIASIAYGTFALLSIPREMMPDVSFPWVFVLTTAPGYSPEEVEKLITNEIEKEVVDIDDINNITSFSRENASILWIKFETMSEDDFDKRLQDLRTEVARVTLPEGAEAPRISRFSVQDHIPMLSVVLSGDLPELEMKRLAEDLRDDILEVKNVSKCLLAGVREREIWVEVDPARLESYELGLSHVMQAIRMKNLDLTAGNVKMGRWEVLVRTLGELEAIETVQRVILKANPMGHHVRVEDVAVVRDTFAERQVISRFDGESATTFAISKKKDGNSLEIIAQIRELVETYRREKLAPGANLTIINDSSVQIREFLGILQNNAVLGLVLVVVCLYVFIGPRNAFFAALGIPMTFFLTFIFMHHTNISMSSNSLFGLVLVLGMIVDDAIVIIENCYRYMQEGHKPREAVLRGTSQVAMPVLSSSLTTIAAFLPLMLMDGVIGEFLKVVPLVVTLALGASLFEAFFILPSHIAEWSRAQVRNHEGFVRFRKVRQLYVQYLARFLRRRYLVVAACTLLIILSIPLVFVVGIDMFATEEIPRLFVFIDLPNGTRIDITDNVMKQAERSVSGLAPGEVRNVITNTGLQQRDEEWLFMPSIGQLIIELSHKRERERSTDAIITDLRTRLNRIAGIKALEFKIFQNGPPTGAAVEVRVRGDYLDELREVVALLKTELRSIKGVYDIRDDFLPGKQELRIVVDEERAALVGLSVAEIAATVRYAFDGGVATQYREGDDEIDVVVKYLESSRSNMADLENLKIVTPTGGLVSLKDVASLQLQPGYANIKHDELKRTITVKADVRASENSALAVNQELARRFAEIAQRYPGYDMVFRGQFEEFKGAFSQLRDLFIIGLMLMYIILAGQFKSFFQPVIIFMAIIFCFLGATIGLLVIGSPFNINNMYGLVALAGVAVNDSLVFISFINEGREKGIRRWRSILQAGKLRLRPILLTTVTTVFGLLPMAVGIGGKSDIWSPLANVMVWGLTIGTLLTLFVVPCIYAILGDINRAFMGRRFIDESGHVVSRVRRALERVNGNGRQAWTTFARRDK